MRLFLFLFLCSLLWTTDLCAATPRFTIKQDERGARLQRDGQDFLIKGVNWGAIPVGENYAYDLWSRSDADIRAVLDVEMPLLKNMGVNAIRQFAMIPPRWVAYIYETYGIHTVMNHLMGRYGFTVDGVAQSPVDYSQPKVRDAIKKDVLDMVQRYKDTPGILFWMLGNENNYGLSWTSSEIENLPQGERDAAKARHLYTLFGDIATAMKAADQQHLVSICNGDLQYLELIAKEAPSIDLLGTNVYRGKNATDLFTRVKAVLGKPVFFSEFGADAFNARTGREDGVSQAELLKSQWLDLYQNTYGQGQAGNAVGGFIFQWSDEWWKYKQTENLAIHDQTASWSNKGYAFDFQEGSDNMNEEWFGIMAKSKNDARGRYQLTPRPAYFVMRDIFAMNPYDGERSSWENRISNLQPRAYEPDSEALRSAGRLADLEKFFLKSANIHLESVQSSGRNTNKTTREGWSSDDHMESATLEWGFRPDPRLEASAAIHVLGHVAENKMDEIFYENRGRPIRVKGEDGKVVTLADQERVKLHRAQFEWNENLFKLEGFYRAPHGHWADEGDFFGLYQETYDMVGIDRYNSDAPNGMVFTGKSMLAGLKVAFGPQIYWGAKPMAIVKYSGQLMDLNYTLMHQQAFAAQKTVATSSMTDPGGRAARTSLSFKTGFFGFGSEWGLLQSGRERIGDLYVRTEESDSEGYNGSDYKVTENGKIKTLDTLAGKFRLIQGTGRLPWYIQGAYRGLVANGGYEVPLQLPSGP
ncbi:MAG TPA: glycoside hydrolase family 2 TIM barrel-domain containing protein [Oligoflexus sp.]|uniref:glycoside hydrolase family 2 TIM barrel-domain containing protein n=1 Tax=Oligoflexus sp. TaxID=1971216 RepID=UPI002D40F8E6|nr:glycoside hydrolase family 2 TIM barrel-domain containing protein [Oligoflexus sp.]HYX33388.1 glycoside hydrolase family 2 TIM barrel-domain containing protein [Oligoflexus sp.]